VYENENRRQLASVLEIGENHFFSTGHALSPQQPQPSQHFLSLSHLQSLHSQPSQHFLHPDFLQPHLPLQQSFSTTPHALWAFLQAHGQ
jgi:hypothetical protein